MAINNPDTYPILYLSDITDDPIDLYFNLGSDRIGCMDSNYRNYSPTAVLDDGSCVGRKTDNLEEKNYSRLIF